ncbi:AAA family ATPase [Nocardia macrotermitis]|uniref:Uncharacterized protein n=1 Tax=Nocardia macrotermitis TaxID=2585198 RepID=A0A7K0D5M1_9NOCA|nr:AAA family ATPase [Nocardia macrotermitis]MQY20134.1 hypothetical protein [Nocardia macrotermitis]
MTTPEPIDRFPEWLREIDVALAAHPQLLITGNLRDLVLLPPVRQTPQATDETPDAFSHRTSTADAASPTRNTVPRNISVVDAPPLTRDMLPRTVSVVDALLAVLAAAGHTAVVVADSVDGARPALDGKGMATALIRNAQPRDGGIPLLGWLPELLRAAVHSSGPNCLIIDGASRLTPQGDFADPAMHRLLVTAEKAMTTAPRVQVPGPHRALLYNTVIWLLDRGNDLPHWLIGGETARVISIPEPEMSQRITLTSTLIPSLPDAPERGSEQFDQVVQRYAARTAGLSLRSIREINRLAIDRRIPARSIEEAVRTFRVGVPGNPWQAPDLRERIRNAPNLLGEKVLGQPAAVRKAVDILIRSALGLTGAQTTGSATRPQGVLFFAGPTGVGKTELAKSIAELVFGREDAFVRFDMSEFSAEHAEARLIGAPPGYTGFDTGGELTNAIRQKPFQLVLFDEIEKAHPRILDKFLQILEDGRLTDGTGATVFFTETLIVFTSNLGVYRLDERGERAPVIARGIAYRQVEFTIRAAVGEHFTREIGRPELLNRIGDNIVVFDFIGEDTARSLIPRFIGNVTDRVRDTTGIEVSVTEKVHDQLLEKAFTKLDFGARGVSSTVESLLVNPLARALFELPPTTRTATVTDLTESPEGWTAVLT